MGAMSHITATPPASHCSQGEMVVLTTMERKDNNNRAIERQQTAGTTNGEGRKTTSGKGDEHQGRRIAGTTNGEDNARWGQRLAGDNDNDWDSKATDNSDNGRGRHDNDNDDDDDDRCTAAQCPIHNAPSSLQTRGTGAFFFFFLTFFFYFS